MVKQDLGFKKVNEFERDLGRHKSSPNANIQYQVPNVATLVKDEYALLGKIIGEHMQSQAPRLAMLYSYYANHNSAIESQGRRDENNSDKADNRPSHPFASFISDFHTTYSVGKPVKTSFKKTDDESDTKNDLLQELNRVNDVDNLNYELYSDASRYGRAYEQVFYDGENVRFAHLSPFTTFIIYDTSVIPQPLMSVRYIEQPLLYDGTSMQYDVDLYTATRYVSMSMVGEGGSLTLVSSEENNLGRVPVVEYLNNKSRTGDYEKVIPLIDLYDAAQADTANWMQDFVNALLVVSGDLDSFGDEDGQALLKANILALKSGKDINGQSTPIDVKFLTKMMDTTGAEAFKQRIASDIFMFSKTPNYVDKDFSSNTSGVALKYRMLSTVSLAEVKRHEFTTGLRKRYDIATDIMRKLSMVGSDWDITKLKVDYVDNVPADEATAITNFVQMSGRISEETLLESVQGILVDDVQDELKRLEAEGIDYGEWMSANATSQAASQTSTTEDES